MDVQCLIVDDEVELAQMTQEYFEMFNLLKRIILQKSKALRRNGMPCFFGKK